ncbi:MAG: serine/threonine-protein kinase [Planctomycetaceae bacterium]
MPDTIAASANPEDTCIVPKYYCSGCNDYFPAASGMCPRCGMSPGDRPDWTHDTQLAAAGSSSNVEPATDLIVATDADLLDGQLLHIYRCERLLGRGGMGVVYLARNESLHRHCALKVLSPKKVSRDVDYVSRFQNEGRAVAALVHPNIVTAHATGQAGDHHFLEMEYVAGQSLQRAIEASKSLGPIGSTAMAVGIAEGLAAAHRLGIVHRDLKPDNVLITPSGIPKIADFGLAKRIVSNELKDTKLAGTPLFMAPELFEGAEATPASDVFALGVCYYLMLTGHYPFAGDTMQLLMNAIIQGTFRGVRRHNPEIPLDVAECVSLMLSRSPQNRPADGAAASQLLQAVLGSVRDLDALVLEAFDGLPNVSVRVRGKAFEVVVKLSGDRTQTVFVENSGHKASERLLLIYSVCCDARPDFYEAALRLNSEVLHGALSVRDVDGKPSFVMVDTFPRATVTSTAIRCSVIEVACRSDNIERMLTGRDVN